MNLGFAYRSVVDAGAAGRTVLEHLVGRYTHSDEAAWRERIVRGEVSLDERTAEAGDRLRAGQSLVWRRPPWEEPAAPLAFAVLFRDPDLLAVAKPRGLPTVPNGGYLTHTLLHLVERRFPGAAPAHRLGRGTSGLLLFARTDRARRELGRSWREGRMGKTYRALVSGRPTRGSFSVETPIGLVAHPRLGRVHAAAPHGKPARSHVRVLESRDDSSLVEVRIETGRPHQIRIHLAAAGHPLVGDPLYARGGGPRDDPGLPGDAGYWLHAHRLELAHPASGVPLLLECGLPPALRSATLDGYRGGTP